MIRLFANANYDFIKWRRWAYGLTAAIIIPGFALFLVRGLNYSIEFTGGTQAVGPKVGRELQGKAFLAIFFSFIVTLIYLAFRFEWRFGLAAVLATFHDILTTIAFIRYLNLEVSLVVVGAVLTMVGYSL